MTSDTRTLCKVRPSRRRSTIAAVPTNRHKAITWIDSTMRYMYCDSWSATLPGVAASHSQKRNKAIAANIYPLFPNVLSFLRWFPPVGARSGAAHENFPSVRILDEDADA